MSSKIFFVNEPHQSLTEGQCERYSFVFDARPFYLKKKKKIPKPIELQTTKDNNIRITIIISKRGLYNIRLKRRILYTSV